MLRLDTLTHGASRISVPFFILNEKGTCSACKWHISCSFACCLWAFSLPNCSPQLDSQLLHKGVNNNRVNLTVSILVAKVIPVRFTKGSRQYSLFVKPVYINVVNPSRACYRGIPVPLDNYLLLFFFLRLFCIVAFSGTCSRA